MSGYHVMFYTSYDVHLSQCAYTIVVWSVFIIMLRICILSKTECKSIYYHFRCDHESNSFRKLARNKWTCRETCDFFCDQFTLLAFNSIVFAHNSIIWRKTLFLYRGLFWKKASSCELIQPSRMSRYKN